ncbi:MAG: hypothetical protein ABJA98_16970 [Acidobacteriota bacterium]
MRRLRWIAAISGVYDLLAGVVMFTGSLTVDRIGDVPLSTPPVYSTLNGVFLIAVGLGYFIPYRDPQRGRPYLWVMGPFLKGAGALTFLITYIARPSPASLLLFAAGDGALALVTVWALIGGPSSTNTPARLRR